MFIQGKSGDSQKTSEKHATEPGKATAPNPTPVLTSSSPPAVTQEMVDEIVDVLDEAEEEEGEDGDTEEEDDDDEKEDERADSDEERLEEDSSEEDISEEDSSEEGVMDLH